MAVCIFRIGPSISPSLILMLSLFLSLPLSISCYSFIKTLAKGKADRRHSQKKFIKRQHS